jgi:hypothetical protein
VAQRLGQPHDTPPRGETQLKAPSAECGQLRYAANPTGSAVFM